jgi:hypothetical protein
MTAFIVLVLYLFYESREHALFPPLLGKDNKMFGKKRINPWFWRTLANLAAVVLIYRLARGFLKLTDR